MVDKKLLAPCGLYCGVCGILIAHRSDNQKFKDKLASVYLVKPEEIVCEGCKSDTKFAYCRVCTIRNCTEKKGIEGCNECDDFPCKLIDNFPMEVGKKVMLRAIPEWKEKGTEKWVEDEEKRYSCPSCGEMAFRGARRCRACKEPLDLDV